MTCGKAKHLVDKGIGMPDLKDLQVLVTPTSYARNDPNLRSDLEAKVGVVIYNTTGRPLSSQELLERIEECDGFIAGLDDINREVIEAANRLKVIARYGVGVDNVDLEAAREKGIVVTNTPGANSASVAELTVGLILSLARNIPPAVQATKLGEWPRMRGVSLVGKTIGLLGFGSIGRQVASRLQGFNCTVIAYDLTYDVEAAEALGVEFRSEDELLRNADFLSLHLPLSAQTKEMINIKFLGKMKPGAFLINTSRGELIDEDALLKALKSGQLSRAALDVFAKQPPGADHPLLALPQVIATPHIGAHTDGATNAMGWMALKDCLAVLRGERPKYRVV
jgi:D-3-phosphoglycerate dehydrogenase